MALSTSQNTHAPLRHGCVAVGTTAVRPALAGGYPAQKGVWLRNPGPEAEVPNTLSVFIGSHEGVSADITDDFGGYELEPGADIFLETDLDSIWLVASAAGPVNVCWLVI